MPRISFLPPEALQILVSPRGSHLSRNQAPASELRVPILSRQQCVSDPILPNLSLEGHTSPIPLAVHRSCPWLPSSPQNL